jgi:hypothetical protein
LRRFDDQGQTLGIYIVSMAALFFLAFAYFAVGQASVARNGVQTAADAAALAAARADRDAVGVDFLAALHAGDLAELQDLLAGLAPHDDAACAAASAYAEENDAEVTRADCVRLGGARLGYTVTARSRHAVGPSVVKGTDGVHAKATATAVVEPRCSTPSKKGGVFGFVCDDGDVTLDPTAGAFRLDLSTFYTVHLSR